MATNGFWSALTIATTQRLPLLFYIEDNGYGISVTSDHQTPGANIARNLGSFSGLNVLQGEGIDPKGAADLIERAVRTVRHERGPVRVGYGGEFVTRRQTKLAVLPLGYADGFTVTPSSTMTGMRGVKSLLAGLRPGHTGPTVTIRDRKAPVVGRVAMQLTSVDVTDIPDVAVGDPVTVPARRIMTSSRIPRIYGD